MKFYDPSINPLEAPWKAASLERQGGGWLSGDTTFLNICGEDHGGRK